MSKITNLKELNEKVWYRFVKVIWVGAALISLLFVNLINFSAYSSAYNFDADNCRSNLTNYLTIDELDAVLRTADFYKGSVFYKYHLLKCSEWKDNTSSYSGILQSDYYRSNLVKADFKVSGSPNHTVNDFIQYVTAKHVSGFIINLLIWNTIFILIFEGSRRIFYYIYFGTFKPLKS